MLRRSDVLETEAAPRFLRIVGMVLLALCLVTTGAYAKKHKGDGDPDAGPFPPDDDPSHYTDVVIDADGDLIEALPHANLGAFEGGVTGTADDTADANVLPEEDQRDDGTFNLPTNGPPSPMFGAKPFTQQMLRLEEFGPGPLDLDAEDEPAGWQSLPRPADAQSTPDGDALDDFLAQDIWPVPTK
ncbi:MAG: hypothetical protein V3R51_04230, partial [Gammaproteobacteria bacterium]